MLNVIAVMACMAWFGLNGLLWYARPEGSCWLIGSSGLGVPYFAGFLLYLQLNDRL